MKRRDLLLTPVALFASSNVLAQSFPTKPIRYIVPVVAGGGSDFVGRRVTERWSKPLGATFVDTKACTTKNRLLPITRCAHCPVWY